MPLAQRFDRRDRFLESAPKLREWAYTRPKSPVQIGRPIPFQTALLRPCLGDEHIKQPFCPIWQGIC